MQCGGLFGAIFRVTSIFPGRLRAPHHNELPGASVPLPRIRLIYNYAPGETKVPPLPKQFRLPTGSNSERGRRLPSPASGSHFRRVTYLIGLLLPLAAPASSFAPCAYPMILALCKKYSAGIEVSEGKHEIRPRTLAGFNLG